jgi:NTE family protein
VLLPGGPLTAQRGAPPSGAVGLALGGGSARGLAHVGVLRWLEEHRIPVEYIAGTSMGGLIGGAYATGMTSDEIARIVHSLDWDELFGASSYRWKSIRRKNDARMFPSRLEFHVRRGVALPSALNSGQQIDLLLARIGALYAPVRSFDALPTPFRCVALDLRSGRAIALKEGSLPLALRATMSIPGIFPPVIADSMVLVDGGAMDNVPADVVRGMGAGIVIAVNVVPLRDRRVALTALELVRSTADAMQRANTMRGMADADIVIDVPLAGYGPEDFQHARAIEQAGYDAAQKMRGALLPLSVDPETWLRYRAARASKRRVEMPRIADIEVEGAVRQDVPLIQRMLGGQKGHPLDVKRVERAVRRLAALGRYVSVTWDLIPRGEQIVLLVRAQPDDDSPPSVLSLVKVENRTSDDYVFQLASRMLAYDMQSPDAEFRVDAGLGTDPFLRGEFREPFGASSFFGAITAAVASHRVDFARRNAIVAQYGETYSYGEIDVGYDADMFELRTGLRGGSVNASVRSGNPGLPSLSGGESALVLRGVLDTQNDPVLPSRGVRAVLESRYVITTPELPLFWVGTRTNEHLAQLEAEMSSVWSWLNDRERVFIVAGGGTSFGAHPLQSDQFLLGLPMRLDAFAVGERRGDSYVAGTLGYLHMLGSLPRLLGGKVAAGGWIEHGSAFDDGNDAHWDTQAGIGMLAETLVGPGVVGYSFGGGANRFYIGFGRLIR